MLACLVVRQASAQSLDDSIRQIPVVAVDAAGIGPEEQELAEEIEAFGPAAIPRLLPLLESPRNPCAISPDTY
jgi:hypothetical protein